MHERMNGRMESLLIILSSTELASLQEIDILTALKKLLKFYTIYLKIYKNVYIYIYIYIYISKPV